MDITERLNQLKVEFGSLQERWLSMASRISDDLHIDDTFIDGEIIRQSQIFYIYSDFLNEVELLYERFKIAYEVLESQRELEIRAGAELNREKITEGKIESLLKSDPELFHWRSEVATVKGLLGAVRCVRDALAQKKDMLVSLSLNLREQFRNDISGVRA